MRPLLGTISANAAVVGDTKREAAAPERRLTAVVSVWWRHPGNGRNRTFFLIPEGWDQVRTEGVPRP